jgi:hypothetical protein
MSYDLLSGTIEEIAAKAERILTEVTPGAWCQAQEWDNRIDCGVKEPNGSIAVEMISLGEATETRIRATAERLSERQKGIQVPLQNPLPPPVYIGSSRYPEKSSELEEKDIGLLLDLVTKIKPPKR